MNIIAMASSLSSPQVLASKSEDIPSPKQRPRRVNGSPPRKPPTIAQLERAIGINNNSATSSSSMSPIMEFLASTPIGQPESPAERKLREAAEWIVDRTEERALVGQKVLLVFCVKILPVWLFLLLVASGLVKLPFDVPFLDDLIA